nr:MAG TPA: hypothetical protein [Caudoviricetes sp.]
MSTGANGVNNHLIEHSFNHCGMEYIRYGCLVQHSFKCKFSRSDDVGGCDCVVCSSCVLSHEYCLLPSPWERRVYTLRLMLEVSGMHQPVFDIEYSLYYYLYSL